MLEIKTCLVQCKAKCPIHCFVVLVTKLLLFVVRRLRSFTYKRMQYGNFLKSSLRSKLWSLKKMKERKKWRNIMDRSAELDEKLKGHNQEILEFPSWIGHREILLKWAQKRLRNNLPLSVALGCFIKTDWSWGLIPWVS